jgi:hypothetical protein
MSSNQIIKATMIAVLIYLGTAFIGMEINPMKWHIAGRFIYIVITLVALAFTFMDENGNIKRDY